MVLAAVPAVGDVLRVRPRVVLGRVHVGQQIVLRFDQEDVRAGRDRVRPLDVEARLQSPPLVAARVLRASGLIDLREASVRSRTGREAERRREHGEIGFGFVVVVRVDDCDRATRARGRVGGVPVRRLHCRRREPRRTGGRPRERLIVDETEQCMTVRDAGCASAHLMDGAPVGWGSGARRGVWVCRCVRRCDADGRGEQRARGNQNPTPHGCSPHAVPPPTLGRAETVQRPTAGADGPPAPNGGRAACASVAAGPTIMQCRTRARRRAPPPYGEPGPRSSPQYDVDGDPRSGGLVHRRASPGSCAAGRVARISVAPLAARSDSHVAGVVRVRRVGRRRRARNVRVALRATTRTCGPDRLGRPGCDDDHVHGPREHRDGGRRRVQQLRVSRRGRAPPAATVWSSRGVQGDKRRVDRASRARSRGVQESRWL